MTTAADLRSELRSAIIDATTSQPTDTVSELLRAVDVVIDAYRREAVSASQSAAEGGGATMTEDVRCHLSLALGHAIGRGVTVPQFDEFAEQLAKRGLVVLRTGEYNELIGNARHAAIMEPTGSAPVLLRDDTRVVVCSECLCACCWLGELMCQGARGAGTVTKTVAELRELGREHSSYWLREEVRP